MASWRGESGRGGDDDCSSVCRRAVVVLVAPDGWRHSVLTLDGGMFCGRLADVPVDAGPAEARAAAAAMVVGLARDVHDVRVDVTWDPPREPGWEDPLPRRAIRGHGVAGGAAGRRSRCLPVIWRCPVVSLPGVAPPGSRRGVGPGWVRGPLSLWSGCWGAPGCGGGFVSRRPLCRRLRICRSSRQGRRGLELPGRCVWRRSSRALMFDRGGLGSLRAAVLTGRARRSWSVRGRGH